MADDTKNKENVNEQGQAKVDPTANNPSVIDAPDRTGGPTSAQTTTQDREAVTNLKPLNAPSPSARADEEVEAQVEQALHEEYVQQEAQRRLASARAQRLMDSVNTENPYGLKPGQKPVYQVGAFLYDPDGNRIQKVGNVPTTQREVIVDRATAMKQM